MFCNDLQAVHRRLQGALEGQFATEDALNMTRAAGYALAEGSRQQRSLHQLLRARQQVMVSVIHHQNARLVEVENNLGTVQQEKLGLLAKVSLRVGWYAKIATKHPLQVGAHLLAVREQQENNQRLVEQHAQASKHQIHSFSQEKLAIQAELAKVKVNRQDLEDTTANLISEQENSKRTHEAGLAEMRASEASTQA
jgi:hypothetical protein